MQATIISDTSCLILLDKIDKLDLLQKLFGEVVTTQVVADEYGKPLPHWVRMQNSADLKIMMVLEAALDKGEASAIALAIEQEDCLLIIDDNRGRKLARQLGLTITGTLGILAQAKEKQLIPALRPLLDQVNQTDFRLSEKLVMEVLKQVGEL